MNHVERCSLSVERLDEQLATGHEQRSDEQRLSDPETQRHKTAFNAASPSPT